jgi:hypothetical protein
MKIILMIMSMFVASNALTASSTQGLVGMLCSDERSKKLLLLNAGATAIQLESVACTIVSDPKSGAGASQSAGFPVPHTIEPGSAFCVALIPTGAADVWLSVTVGGKVDLIKITKVDVSKPWIEMNK